MNELTIMNHSGADVVDSRQVAAMIGKEHYHLMRDIAGYIENMQEATESKLGLSKAELNFEPSDFFIENTYKDSTGRSLPCYLITKKGCDMVANKMTGKKGVLFTAAYVTAFEAMRDHIQTGRSLRMARKSEQELAAADRRARAMMLNAKNRTADRLQHLYDLAGVKPEYQALAISDFFAEDGVKLPRIALQGTRVTYDKGTIAEKLGVLSQSGKPHAQAIGAIISNITVDPEEIELVPYHHNGHDGADKQYAESVISKIAVWLEEHRHPAQITMPNGKMANVQYSMNQKGRNNHV